MVTSADIIDLIVPDRLVGPKENINESQPLVQQGIDSLEVATLLFEVEHKFDVKIPTSIAGRLNSLKDITDFINASRTAGTSDDR